MRLQSLLQLAAVACAITLFSFGCSSVLTERRIKHDLIGHTTGGREKSWLFQNIAQIEDVKIEFVDGNDTYVSVVLHDPRTPYTFDATLKLTYENGTLKNVGLMFIRQRRP